MYDAVKIASHIIPKCAHYDEYDKYELLEKNGKNNKFDMYIEKEELFPIICSAFAVKIAEWVLSTYGVETPFTTRAWDYVGLYDRNQPDRDGGNYRPFLMETVTLIRLLHGSFKSRVLGTIELLTKYKVHLIPQFNKRYRTNDDELVFDIRDSKITNCPNIQGSGPNDRFISTHCGGNTYGDYNILNHINKDGDLEIFEEIIKNYSMQADLGIWFEQVTCPEKAQVLGLAADGLDYFKVLHKYNQLDQLLVDPKNTNKPPLIYYISEMDNAKWFLSLPSVISSIENRQVLVKNWLKYYEFLDHPISEMSKVYNKLFLLFGVDFQDKAQLQASNHVIKLYDIYYLVNRVASHYRLVKIGNLDLKTHTTPRLFTLNPKHYDEPMKSEFTTLRKTFKNLSSTEKQQRLKYLDQ